MRQLLLGVCLSLIASLLHAPTAGACINDRATVQTEKEFKKHYEFKSSYKESQYVPESSPAVNSWEPVAAMWMGGGLLLGSVGLVTFNVRRYGRAQR